jgi:choline dehydrogenase
VIDSRGYARGVIYRRNHQDVEVRANKEVILCAGVFNTPKLLMLSGVGPTQHLRDMGVN